MRPIPAIVGPTASGKSDLGIGLALARGGEVINLDSVQVYRRIEIATAKVPVDERKGVPHHLIDIVEPTVNFTAGDWVRAALPLIHEIESRGKVAVLVGGSGFYLRALTDGLFDAPVVEPELRARLAERAERHGAARLHRLLRRLDPISYTQLAPRDKSRVIRALELRIASGVPASALLRDRPRRVLDTDVASRVRIIALEPPRDALYERINARTDAMFAAGLLSEVETLLASGVPPTAKALGAHGYRRVVEHLLGKRSLDSAIEQTKLDTRHYAKRQITWWRGTDNVHWISDFGVSSEALRAALLYLGGEIT